MSELDLERKVRQDRTGRVVSETKRAAVQRIDPGLYGFVTDRYLASSEDELRRGLQRLKAITGPQLARDSVAKHAVRDGIALIYRELDARAKPAPVPAAPIEAVEPEVRCVYCDSSVVEFGGEVCEECMGLASRPRLELLPREEPPEAVAAQPEPEAVEVGPPFGMCAKHHDLPAVGMTDRCEGCWVRGE